MAEASAQVAAQSLSHATIETILPTVASALKSGMAARSTATAVASGTAKFLGSVATAPIVEAAALALDNEEHTMDEYGKAVVRGTVTGAISWSATAATGAIIGSAFPVAGNIIGWGVGAIAGLTANAIWKSQSNPK